MKHTLDPCKNVQFIWVDETSTTQPSKFAPVAPIHIYEAMANRGYQPENILLLAHDVVKNENLERYERLFQGKWASTHIIMDNSVIELGGAVDLGMIQEAVSIVDADVVVLPDSLTDGPASAELTIKDWDLFKTVFDPMNVALMAVVQGETEYGFMSALERIAKEIEPDWISIPRRTESKFGYTRNQLIEYVDIFFPKKPIHLLGFSEFPWNDILAARNPRVRSIDSTVPLRVEMPFSDSGPSRGNWWDTVTFSTSMLDLSLIHI